jgi:Ca-activated chloride channel homolog
MTRINPDDPKWTAYILGEFNDSERATIEAELEASEEARSLVEELRMAADLTKMELQDQAPLVALTPQQRETIRAEAGVEKPRRWFGARPMVWATGLAVAASIALMVAITPEFLIQHPTKIADAVIPEQPSVDPGLRYEHPALLNAQKQEMQKQEVQKQTPQPPEQIAAEPAPVPSPPVPVKEIEAKQTDLRAENAPLDKALSRDVLEAQAAPPPPPVRMILPAAGAGVGGGRMAESRSQDQLGQQALGFAQTLTAPLPPPGTTPPYFPGTLPLPPGVPGDALNRIFFPNNRGGEAYNAITDNSFTNADQTPLSTFSADVDTASYANIRRYLNQNQLPPRDAVRIEEMINYFAYDYPQPAGNNPIGATLEAAAAPWNPQHRLVRIAIKAKDVDVRRRPPSNLVFLLDVSGSMQPLERLPLIKQGIRMMVDQLTANDHVSVVTYAGTTGVALQPTRGDQKDTILNLIDSLQAGGSTNGGGGIQLAYQQAMANFIPNGMNRVILATDGDFNVGITNRNQLVRMVEEKARSGVFLTVLGVGMGNYKDATLEMLADKGHGNYAYLDSVNEARKVLVDQMSSTFVTVAKDVKIQVEFNPAVVGAYRLIGYENRALRAEDFNNDQKDAGDMGAGHTVTALYEVVPRGVSIDSPGIDPLKYQQPAPPPKNASNETLNVKIRYKEPAASDSKLLVFPLVDREQAFAKASADFRFAAAVASFGMILRDSPYKGTSTFDSTLAIAEDSMGSDRNGYRREFMQLVQHARQRRVR